jgi:hypothetical protein
MKLLNHHLRKLGESAGVSVINEFFKNIPLHMYVICLFACYISRRVLVFQKLRLG